LLIILALPPSVGNITAFVLPGGKSIKIQCDWPSALCSVEKLFGDDISPYHPKKSTIGKMIRILTQSSSDRKKPKTVMNVTVPFVIDSRPDHMQIRRDGELVNGDRIVYVELEILPKINSVAVVAEDKN
jgi:hypothetical protein